jgi:hypothetical protein
MVHGFLHGDVSYHASYNPVVVLGVQMFHTIVSYHCFIQCFIPRFIPTFHRAAILKAYFLTQPYLYLISISIFISISISISISICLVYAVPVVATLFRLKHEFLVNVREWRRTLPGRDVSLSHSVVPRFVVHIPKLFSALVELAVKEFTSA